jgi:hypothetical protein
MKSRQQLLNKDAKMLARFLFAETTVSISCLDFGQPEEKTQKKTHHDSD